MSSNKGGVVVALIIVVVVSASFAYILSSPTGGGLQPSKNPTSYTQYINLGADAAGWEYNYNASHRNPVLNIKESTLVYFNVTEIDGAPHNLYIAYDGAYSSSTFANLVKEQINNPKSIEGSTNYQILTVAQVTQTIGHSTQGSYPFFKTGIYTYWCSIHYETMVGLLIVNATSGSTSAVLTPLHSGATPVHTGNMPLIYSTSGFNSALALNSIETVE